MKPTRPPSPPHRRLAAAATVAILATILVAILALTGCDGPPEAPTANPDAQALEIVQRATTAPASLQQARVELEQVDLTHLARGERPRSVTENKRLRRHLAAPQPDGSTLYTHRTRGWFEYRAPDLFWLRLQRSGRQTHTHVSFSDGESSYMFTTRFPDSISMRPAPGDESAIGPPGLTWSTASLRAHSERATTMRWRGREPIRGVLCDVIDLTVPVRADAPDGEIRQIAYYVGVADGLIRRSVEVRGSPRHRIYREVLCTVDTAFIADRLTYARFEDDVGALLDGKALPPVVARMQ